MNLLCGSVAVYRISSSFDVEFFTYTGVQNWLSFGVEACYLIIAGAVFDFFDGLSARVLKVSSAIGKELDSLADMVTFGLAPSFLISTLISKSFSGNEYWVATSYNTPSFYTFLYLGLSIIGLSVVLGSALRLAKFNIDTEQSTTFKGLPTPASAMFFIGLFFFYKEYQASLEQFAATPFILAFFALAIAILMNVNLPMFSFKFKELKWKGNEIRFIFLAICVVFLAIFQLAGLSLCILLYIVLSIIQKFTTK